MSHYEARLEKDLNRIHDRVRAIGQLAEEALANAVQATLSGNQALAYDTIIGDERINREVRRIDRLCHEFVAVHLPSAGHLRRISATIRAIQQLERIGDYAVIIAREGVQLERPPGGSIGRELDIVSNDSRRMLHQAISAFNDGNGEVARATMHMADNAEHTMDQVYDELLEEEHRIDVKEMVALFAIYNMLKRVWDQAKNICEETVFYVYGETKPEKVYKILFLDEDNASLSQMAEAIAARSFPDRGNYASAGRRAAERPDPAMVAFMAEHGYDLSAATTTALDARPEHLSDYFLVVSLQGPVSSYLPRLPFHTSALVWDVGSPPEPGDRDRARQSYEEIYRDIAVNIHELMERLTGAGSD